MMWLIAVWILVLPIAGKLLAKWLREDHFSVWWFLGTLAWPMFVLIAVVNSIVSRVAFKGKEARGPIEWRDK